jgi:hypothetical protein
MTTLMMLVLVSGLASNDEPFCAIQSEGLYII